MRTNRALVYPRRTVPLGHDKGLPTANHRRPIATQFFLVPNPGTIATSGALLQSQRQANMKYFPFSGDTGFAKVLAFLMNIGFSVMVLHGLVTIVGWLV